MKEIPVYHNYIQNKIIASFLSALFTLSILLAVLVWISVSDKFAFVDLSFLNFMEIFSLLFFIKLMKGIIPAAVFFGTAFFCYRMANSLEYLGFCSLGLTLEKTIVIVTKTLFPLVVAVFIAQMFLLPQLEYRNQKLKNNSLNNSIVAEIKGGVFSALNNNNGVLFMGEMLDDKNSNFATVFIFYEQDDIKSFEIAKKISFAKGEEKNVIYLEKGKQFIIDKNSPKKTTLINYEERNISTKTRFEQWLPPKIKSFSTANLLMVSRKNSDDYQQAVFEFQKRISTTVSIFLYPIVVILILFYSINPRRKFKIFFIIILFFIITLLRVETETLLKLGLSNHIGYYVANLLLSFYCLGMYRYANRK